MSTMRQIESSAIIDLFPWPQEEPVGDGRRNLYHYCLVIEPTDLNEVADYLRGRGVTIVGEAPVQRSGARGTATSIYIKDWDGNTIGHRHYSEGLTPAV